MSQRVTVFAPATVANLGPGFDILGLALESPGDTVVAHRTDEPQVTLTRVEGMNDTLELPPAGANNTAVVAADQVLERLGRPFGVQLELRKGLPLGSGLGSSGASAAAAAVAVNLLAGTPLTPSQLVQPCALAEAAACGSAHADNVAPALLGGITLVRTARDVTRIETALQLFVAVVAPRQRLSPREARDAIPAAIPLADHTHNAAHLASLVYALAVGDLQLLGRVMVDRVAEPRRAHLIPGFSSAKRAALEAGALGASISGAGPALFALCTSRTMARAAGDAMADALLRETGARPVVHTSPVAATGARSIDA